MDALEPTAPAYNQVTWQQYHRKQIEMAIRDNATPSIQAVANELNISLDEAEKHQAYIDKIMDDVTQSISDRKEDMDTADRYRDLNMGGKKSRRKSGRKSGRHSKKSRKSRRHSKKSRKCRR